MATREQCVQAAMAGGLQRTAAVDVVNALFEDKSRVLSARAEGKVVNADAAMAEAWAKRMAEAEIQTAVARKQAAINILRRRDIESYINAVKTEGFSGMDALEALLVGSNKRFTGARDSIDATSAGIRKDFLGSLINDLENVEAAGMPVRKLLTSDSGFNADVVREMISPGSTRDATAAQVADVFGRHLEKARLRMNDAGAYIGKLDGYVPQSHDAWKLTATRSDGKTARQGWKDSIRGKLDTQRTFGDAAPEEIETILDDIYDNIVLGRDAGPSAAERGERPGVGSRADRLSRRRVLHFRDADAWMAYHEEFGKGGPLAGVLTHMSNAARSLALMERLGPNPEVMLKSVIAAEARGLREAEAGGLITNEGMDALADLRAAEGLQQGRVANWWAELTGQANWPLSGKLARFASIARATQTLSKLGGASLSAVSDVFVKAMNMRNVSGMNWGESVARSLGQYFRRYPGREMETARQLGAFIDDVANDFRLRWDVNETRPGFLGGLQDKLFKWSGLNWITESGKAGYATWFSGHFGSVAAKKFDQLDAPRVATLTWHGIDARKWEAMRHMTETMPDGRQLLVPERAGAIPDSAIDAYIAGRLAEARKSIKDDAQYAQAASNMRDRARRRLRTDLIRMISDETQYAILEPDARTRAFMRQGTRPGTLAGEFWRTIMQFKSFPIAYMQRQFGGRRWVRGDLQQGMRYGFNAGSVADAVKYDVSGVVGAALTAFAFGYLSMTLKDMARGRTPRDPRKPETVFAALLQSGGAGIFGDFFFNKASRFGDSFAGTLTGPLPGEIGRLLTSSVPSLLRGEWEAAGEDTLRTALDNVPFINFWYTREAVNWLALYHLREMMSPGTLARTERKLKQDFDQTYIISPAQNIRRGGWRNGPDDWR